MRKYLEKSITVVWMPQWWKHLQHNWYEDPIDTISMQQNISLSGPICIAIDDIWIITISNRVISLFLVRIPLLLLIITVHFSHRENQFLISLQWWFKHIQPLWDRKKVLWLCAQTRMDHSQQLTPVTTNSVIPSLW